MKINEDIYDIFREFSIDREDGMCYLISLYFGFDPSYIPSNLKAKVNATKIVEKGSKGLQWNIPLFDKQETAFKWVEDEYVPLIRESSQRDGPAYITESVRRMKKFFSENPDVRKQDVMEATKMYVRQIDPNFIQYPHYFISKGKGAEKTSNLLTWIEKYREEKVEETFERKGSNTIL